MIERNVYNRRLIRLELHIFVFQYFWTKYGLFIKFVIYYQETNIYFCANFRVSIVDIIFHRIIVLFFESNKQKLKLITVIYQQLAHYLFFKMELW